MASLTNQMHCAFTIKKRGIERRLKVRGARDPNNSHRPTKRAEGGQKSSASSQTFLVSHCKNLYLKTFSECAHFFMSFMPF